MSIVVDRVNVRFGGVAAMTDVSIRLDSGRVVSVSARMLRKRNAAI